jgi:hypothetical protein
MVTMLGCAVGLGAVGHSVHDPLARVRLAMLATVLAIAAVAPGLDGDDADLERVAAFAWPPRRAAHLVIAGAIAVGLLAATALAGDPMTTTARLVRDATGLIGLVGLGAAVLGASRAFLLPLISTAFALGLQGALGSQLVSAPRYQLVTTWIMQPTSATIATVTALVLGATGVLAYALVGSRP